MKENNDIFSSQLPAHLSKYFSEQTLIDSSIFVTLRFSKRPNLSRIGQVPADVFLCDTTIRKNYDYFWDALNYSLFGKRYQRTKKKTDKCQLRHLSVLHEHTVPNNSHIHSIICAPVFLTRNNLAEIIRDKWSNTFFGKCDSGWSFNLREIYSKGILNYPFRDQNRFYPHTLSAYIGPDIASARIAF